MNYDIEIRKNKSNAKCRICFKAINVGTICVFTTGNDGYNLFRLVTHTDCFLCYIIKEVKQFQIRELKKEMDKFNKIEKLLKDGNIKTNPKRS